ncbi:MAG: hypothetical protein MRZ70_05270 [Prevotella sp.]|nr:hypothetical protein [Prevotella sp.]
MTNNDDKLKSIGKRTPYIMPADLFGRMQKQVMRRIDGIEKARQARKRRQALVIRLSVAATAIAASVSLVVLLRLGNINGSGDDGMRQANSTAVDKAYENLSQQERENLLADYKNDIYMSLQ